MPAKNLKTSYQQLSQELAGLIEWFESENVNLDEAAEKYEQAMNVISQMENHLLEAQNKIKKISAKFGDE